MINAPANAPYGLPMPPNISAANIGSRNRQPIIGARLPWNTASRMPAVAASAAPKAQVHRMTCRVSMPLTSARSGLSAIARIALPIRVRLRM